MADYRVYLLDDHGSIVEGANASYDDDSEAQTAVGSGLSLGHRAEIWCGTRLIGQVSSGQVSSGLSRTGD